MNNRISGNSGSLPDQGQANLLLARQLPKPQRLLHRVQNIGQAAEPGLDVTINTVNLKTPRFYLAGTTDRFLHLQE